jgi:hypothetical protein
VEDKNNKNSIEINKIKKHIKLFWFGKRKCTQRCRKFKDVIKSYTKAIEI